MNVMGSLSHSVVFHVNSKELVMKEDEWWCQEQWTSRSEGGRAMVDSRIMTRDGLHIATTWQDGVARKARGPQDEKIRILWYDCMAKNGRLPKGVQFKL